MKLDTASFDLIKTKSGEYVFLEVNPFGNIEMINETCGYEIDKRFAEIILDKYSDILWWWSYSSIVFKDKQPWGG